MVCGIWVRDEGIRIGKDADQDAGVPARMATNTRRCIALASGSWWLGWGLRGRSLRFRNWGLRIRDESFRFRVQGLGVRVWGSWFRV